MTPLAKIKGLLLIVVTLATLGLASFAQSESPSLSPSATPSAETGPQALESLSELKARLDKVEESLKTAPTPSSKDVVDDPTTPPPYIASMRRMETNLRRLITLKEADALLQTKIEKLDKDLQDFTQNGLENERPFSVSSLDSFQGQLSLAKEKLESEELALKSAESNLELAEDQLQSRQAQRRRLIERSQQSDGVDLELDRQLEKAGAAVSASELAVELAEAEADTARRSIEVVKKRQDLLNKKIALVKPEILFSESTLRKQIEALETERKRLSEKLEEVKSETEKSLEALKSIQEDSIDDDQQEAEIRAKSEWLTTHQQQKTLLEEHLELNLTQQDLWAQRYQLSQNTPGLSWSNLKDATSGLIVRLNNREEVLASELSQLRSRMAVVLEEAPQGSKQSDRRWETLEAQAIAEHQDAIENALRALSETRALADRLLSEIRAQNADVTWQERVGQGWSTLMGVWNTELYTIGDSSVTVGKVSIALLVLILGLTAVGRASKMVSRKLLQKLPITDASRANIERTLHYFFIFFVFLFALRVVNIPLTIFTFLGGTLAIAVGFGAQNILNNFISGLILMVERPIRVGDLIEVEGTAGVVQEIGARSTRILMGTGIHVVVPNSFLLENSVTNWTLADQQVRTSVTVGVAYGSDTKLVTSLMEKAAFGEDRVEKTPAPIITFDDFADSSLNFTVHFWLRVLRPMDRKITESQVRYAIDDLFRQNGVTIPFPQRDLNFPEPVSFQRTDNS